MAPDYAERLSTLETCLGIEFRDRSLLIQALTHRSYLNEHAEHSVGHNERLEFLGDAVLAIIVVEHLFRTYPKEDEGTLTERRARLVNGAMLGSIAATWDLDDCLLMARGQAREPRDSKARKYIRANAFEAILGALYLDQGMGACRFFVDMHVLRQLPQIMTEPGNPKEELQVLVQERFACTPIYTVVKAWGADHDKRFRIAVVAQGIQLADAEGTSKHEAETAAAAAALATIATWENRLMERERRPCTARNSGKDAGS